MKLSQFITEHIEAILTDWDSFAETLRPAASEVSIAELRDHGRGVLQEIARNMENESSVEAQAEKALADPPVIDSGSAAAAHGEARHDSGFTLLQLTAEYRALRASVLRLWMPRITRFDEQRANELVRFNAAIDQAMAESACTFSERNAQVRDTFLAILGHDLRSPLATMTLAGDYLTRPGVGSETTQHTGARVKRSAATMVRMVGDLLEYARTQLGGKLPITRQLADVREICLAALADAQAAHTKCNFEFEAAGELCDDFDSPRVQQAVANLLHNAAQYRDRSSAVTLSVRGEAAEIIVQVRNFGPLIPPAARQEIFKPLVQLRGEDGPATSLGLGLFIAREIAMAHGGSISVESDATAGTVFTLRFPRVQTP
jgi:signal transduction histidine kinase